MIKGTSILFDQVRTFLSKAHSLSLPSDRSPTSVLSPKTPKLPKTGDLSRGTDAHRPSLLAFAASTDSSQRPGPRSRVCGWWCQTGAAEGHRAAGTPQEGKWSPLARWPRPTPSLRETPVPRPLRLGVCRILRASSPTGGQQLASRLSGGLGSVSRSEAQLGSQPEVPQLPVPPSCSSRLVIPRHPLPASQPHLIPTWP